MKKKYFTHLSSINDFLSDRTKFKAVPLCFEANMIWPLAMGPASLSSTCQVRPVLATLASLLSLRNARQVFACAVPLPTMFLIQIYVHVTYLFTLFFSLLKHHLRMPSWTTLCIFHAIFSTALIIIDIYIYLYVRLLLTFPLECKLLRARTFSVLFNIMSPAL